MATRVIAAQDKTSSGAGDDVQIKAGNANTSGAGGSIIFQPGVQATTGGNGTINFNDTSGNPVAKLSTDSNYLTVTPQSSKGFRIINSTSSTIFTVTNGIPDFPFGAGFNSQAVANVGSIYNAGYAQMLVINPKLQWPTNTPTSAIENGSVGQIKVTDGSTGGGSFAYTSATPTALSTNPTNDLVLTGSAFQRLSSSSALSVTGIAPPATGAHVDGRLIWLYNVGSFNITLKHSQTSTAANQFINEGSGDIVLGPGRMVQAIYDSTSSKWRVNGETYPYVFPTADGTNGQVLTTNGSGTLSWTTVSAGASASGTTNYIAKFTGTSTLGNSLIYDDGSNIGIGTTTTNPLGNGGSNRTIAIQNGSGNVGISLVTSATTDGSTIGFINFGSTSASTNKNGASINAELEGAVTTDANTRLAFYTRGSGTQAERLRITGSGNVGIGTASPTQRLHVVADSSLTNPEADIGVYAFFLNSNATTNAGSAIGLGANNNAGALIVGQRVGANNESVMKFQTRNSAGTSATRMTIASNGWVGIGTTTPQMAFDVTGAGRFGTGGSTSGSLLNITGGAYNQFNLSSGSGWGLLMGHGDGSQTGNYHGTNVAAIINVSAAALHLGTSNTSRIMIDSAGNVGIGNTSPGAQLQVTSSAAATKGLIVKGAATQSANLTEWQDSTGTVVAAVSPTGAFTGSSFTPYGTFNSTTTIFGNNYWTPNYTGGVTSPSAGTYTKSTGNANTWDGQVYSSEGYTKNVYCAARASQTNGYIMFGLNSDPTTDASYVSLDYAWYIRGDNTTVEIYENGGLVSSYGSYTTSTVLSITYDGSNVQYWKDGVIQRTVARSTGNPLYFDTSFYTLSSSLNSVQFGPIGQPFGISGTTNYLPKFTSQQTLGNTNIIANGDVTVKDTVNRTIEIYNSSAVGVDKGGTISFRGTYRDFDFDSVTFAQITGAKENGSQSNAAGYLKFSTWQHNGTLTERMRVDSAGNVGIGATSPVAKLQLGTGTDVMANSGGLTVVGGDVVLDGAGTYANRELYFRYTSAVATISADKALRFRTSNGSTPVEAMRIDVAGNVGIGTASPSFKLQVDAASVDANIVANVTSGYGGIGVYAAGTNKVILGYVGANTNYGSQTVAGDIALKTNNSNLHINTGSGNSVTTAYFSSAGNVGIGNVSPGARLQVDTGATGTKGQIIKAFLGQSANLSEWQSSTGTALGYINSDMSQLVTPATFTLGSQSNNSGVVELYSGTVRLRPSSLGNYIFTLTQRGVDIGAGVGDTVPVLKVTRYADGNVGPVAQFVTGSTTHKGLVITGVASQTGNLQEWQNSSGTALAYMDANGNFAAVTKSFLIPHPTPAKAAEGKKLRYASLEGPENGVYFRGRLEGENVIILPDYWVDLVDPDSITVNLTARKFAQPSLFVVDANAERVVIESDRQVCCDFIVYATRKDIAKLEVEPDGN